MSRDAKVGLVIVFAFVFLLGSILVHRLHLTDPGQTESSGGVAATEGDESADQSSGAGAQPQIASAESSPTIINGLPADTRNPPTTRSGGSSSIGPTFAGSLDLTGRSSPNKPPTELSESPDSGAYISLTDPNADRQPAAIVEPPTATRSLSSRTPGSEHAQPSVETDNRSQISARSQPLLEIRGGPPPGENEIPELQEEESQIADAAADVNSLETDEGPTELPDEGSDLSHSSTGQEESDSLANSTAGRRVPPLDRPPPFARSDDATSDADMDPIQQAAGRRGSEPEDRTPPRLPKFAEPQPSIEAVPGRGDLPSAGREQAVDPRYELPGKGRAPAMSPAEDEHLTVQKTYVVKEGDSFWSISAKHYGTGKHFRALEEFNRDRLSASGKSGKVLRPGMTIVIPPEAHFRSRPSLLRSAESAPKKSSSTDPWREESPRGGQHQPSGRVDSGGGVPSTPLLYRVQEGDTLSTIAQRELGSAKRWQEIYQLNRDKLPDERSLRAGMELRMPPVSTSEKVAGRPKF